MYPECGRGKWGQMEVHLLPGLLNVVAMKFHILTLFPDMVMQGLTTSIIGRAGQRRKIDIDAVNIRDYTQDKHGRVDDYTYGGGAGMLMQAQPVYDAYRVVAGDQKGTLRLSDTTGNSFYQKKARELSGEEELVLLCGHYEGIDERVLEEVVTDYISIGDYVLTGGELAAMVVVDAVARLVPGVLNNDESAETESFHNDLLEYPQHPARRNGTERKYRRYFCRAIIKRSMPGGWNSPRDGRKNAARISMRNIRKNRKS